MAGPTTFTIRVKSDATHQFEHPFIIPPNVPVLGIQFVATRSDGSEVIVIDRDFRLSQDFYASLDVPPPEPPV